MEQVFQYISAVRMIGPAFFIAVLVIAVMRSRVKGNSSIWD